MHSFSKEEKQMKTTLILSLILNEEKGFAETIILFGSINVRTASDRVKEWRRTGRFTERREGI